MKLSVWYKGRHIEVDGTKDEIMEFLENLPENKIKVDFGRFTTSPITYWGGCDPENEIQ